MKHLLLFGAVIVTIVLVGCHSHKKAAVSNASPEFSSEVTWKLMEMKGKEVVLLEGQKEITIQINPEAGTFGGSNGCNRYFGTFKDDGNGRMILADFNGTKMACPEAFHKMESNYMQLLRRCNGYNLGEYTLELTQDGKTLLSFEKMQKPEE